MTLDLNEMRVAYWRTSQVEMYRGRNGLGRLEKQPGSKYCHYSAMKEGDQ